MKIIGAGLPRSGTLSQKIALEMLGAGPCYHMVEVLGDLTKVGGWRKAADDPSLLPHLLEGYQSTVDWPGGAFYKQLLDIYPDAKVLLSVRDPQRWAASFVDTIWNTYHGDSLMFHLSGIRRQVDPGWAEFVPTMNDLLFGPKAPFTEAADDPGKLPELATRWYDEVRSTVPANRLIDWQLEDGWAPLCEALNVPVPQGEFPRVNDGAEFKFRILDLTTNEMVRYRDEQAKTLTHEH